MFSGPASSRSTWHVGARALRRAATVMACALLFPSCRDVAPCQSAARQRSAIEISDDAGRVVHLDAPATRVISLTPSATETLIALGATDRIVGRTRYDVASEVAALPSVGGTTDPSIEAIVSLRPDLVIAWDADKRQAARERLVALGVRVFTVRTQDTSDVYRTVANLARLTGRDSAGGALATSIRGELDDVRRSVAGRPAPRVLYVVFNDPPMTAGPKTFIGELIGVAGGRSIFDDTQQLWPNVSMEEIVRRQPDLLVVPVGEFKTNTVDHFRGQTGWRNLRAVREGHIATVPADLLSRPSANIGRAARALRAAFYPEFATGVDSPRSAIRGPATGEPR
jgi:iron complex transport system substrate-binding protein